MVKLAEILDKPEKWTKGVNARDSKGNQVAVCDQTASCFCLAGAALRAISMDPSKGSWSYFEAIRTAVYELRPLHGTLLIPSFNDSPLTTYHDVYKVVQRADEIIAAKCKE